MENEEKIIEVYTVNGEIVDEKTFKLAKRIQQLEIENQKLKEENEKLISRKY